MRKEGIGIQFNWIFVAIAGAMFLAFFAFFGSRYFDLEQSKENAKIVRALDNSILNAKGLSQYKEFGEGFSKFKLNYDCNDIFVNNEQKLGLNYIIFADNETNSVLSLWSKEYSKPYFIDNVVFMWNSDLKFYLDNSLSDDFKNDLPNEIKLGNKEDADVLVYFGSANPIQGKKVIAFNENIISYVNENKNFYYNGDSIFVYGAMFSSPDVFECTKNNLEERELSLKDIYIKKAQFLSAKCDTYSEIIDALKKGQISVLNDLNERLYNLNCEVLY